MTRNVTCNSASSSPTITEVFAARLHQAQEEAEVNNEALSRDLEVSLRLIYMWREGNTLPTQANLTKLSQRFGRPTTWFFSDGRTEAA